MARLSNAIAAVVAAAVVLAVSGGMPSAEARPALDFAAVQSPSFMEEAAGATVTYAACLDNAKVPGFTEVFTEAERIYPKVKALWAKFVEYAKGNDIELVEPEKSINSEMKGKERACVKCLCKYAKLTKPQGTFPIPCGFDRLRDVVRTTFTFKNKEGLKKFAEGLFRKGINEDYDFRVLETKNAYRDDAMSANDAAKDSGYRDIKVMIKLPGSGIVIENQLQLVEMHDAKMGHLFVHGANKFLKGHTAYKCQRIVDEWRASRNLDTCKIMPEILKVWYEPALTLKELLSAYESATVDIQRSGAIKNGKTAALNNYGFLATLGDKNVKDVQNIEWTDKRYWNAFHSIAVSHAAAVESSGVASSNTHDMDYLVKLLRDVHEVDPNIKKAAKDKAINAMMNQGTNNFKLVPWLADDKFNHASVKPEATGGFPWLTVVRDITLSAARRAYAEANTGVDKEFMRRVHTYQKPPKGKKGGDDAALNPAKL